MVEHEKIPIEEGFRLLQLDSEESIKRCRNLEKLNENVSAKINPDLEWSYTGNSSRQENDYAKLE